MTRYRCPAVKQRSPRLNFVELPSEIIDMIRTVWNFSNRFEFDRDVVFRPERQKARHFEWNVQGHFPNDDRGLGRSSFSFSLPLSLFFHFILLLVAVFSWCNNTTLAPTPEHSTVLMPADRNASSLNSLQLLFFLKQKYIFQQNSLWYSLMILTEGEQSSFFAQVKNSVWMCWLNYVDRMRRSEFCFLKKRNWKNENSGCAPVEGNKELKFAKGADVLIG
jgi:hypothetical protein